MDGWQIIRLVVVRSQYQSVLYLSVVSKERRSKLCIFSRPTAGQGSPGGRSASSQDRTAINQFLRHSGSGYTFIQDTHLYTTLCTPTAQLWISSTSHCPKQQRRMELDRTQTRTGAQARTPMRIPSCIHRKNGRRPSAYSAEAAMETILNLQSVGHRAAGSGF